MPISTLLRCAICAAIGGDWVAISQNIAQSAANAAQGTIFIYARQEIPEDRLAVDQALHQKGRQRRQVRLETDVADTCGHGTADRRAGNDETENYVYAIALS